MTTRLEDWLVEHPDWQQHTDLLIAPPKRRDLKEEFPDGVESESDTDMMTSYGCSRRALYMKIRRGGASHRFADMVACQRGPGLMTDSVFFAGLPKLQDQFVDDTQREKVIAVARRNGYNPSPNDVYEPGLARFQGDPEAFVPPSGGRGYIRRLCEKRGWACDGAVKVQHQQPGSDPFEASKPLAEDLITGHMRAEIKKNPALKNKKKELREKIIAKHGVV